MAGPWFNHCQWVIKVLSIHQNLKLKIILMRVLLLNVITFILTIYMIHYECINLRQTNMLHVMIYRLIAKNMHSEFNLLTIMLQNSFPTLHTKKNYVLYIENLNLYLSLGVKLGKVHRVLEFDQSPFLKDYINFKTEKQNIYFNKLWIVNKILVSRATQLHSEIHLIMLIDIHFPFIIVRFNDTLKCVNQTNS